MYDQISALCILSLLTNRTCRHFMNPVLSPVIMSHYRTVDILSEVRGSPGTEYED
jgi:hypothetical protein